MTRRPDLRPRAGFTILELSISITLLAIIVLAATRAVDSTQGTWATGIRVDELDTSAQTALDRIAHDLTPALRASLAPATTLPGQSTSTLDFRGNAGWAAGAIVPGPLERISLELEGTELDDGLDNDSDGLIDERVLVWRVDPGGAAERRSVLTRRVSELLEGELPNGLDDNGNGLVDESGFCASIDGDTITLRLTLQRRIPEGTLLTTTVETRVRVRN